MTVGDRIKRIRNLRGLTQKELGLAIGYDESSADVRIAQYEAGTRTPKENLIAQMAAILDVNALALSEVDIDSHYGLIHALFTLEDTNLLKINERDDELCITLNKDAGISYSTMFEMFSDWHTQSQKLKNAEITKEEYDNWRYNYPEFDDSQMCAKTPSQELSDAMAKKFKDKLKDM